ncbi:MAG: iron-sulfur cluster carrier protein ApbC [Gammaproteobacteria bacterium]
MSQPSAAAFQTALADCRLEGLDAAAAEALEFIGLEPSSAGPRARLRSAIPLQGIVPRLAEALAGRVGIPGLSLGVETRVGASSRRAGVEALERVANVIAVASGKGGVGKSTTAVNLALALAAEGARVGLLDADIYGPSQQLMLGIPEDRQPTVRDGKFFEPVMAHGLQTMSMGYLLTEKTPVVWRGPMASGALQQMLTQTLWHDIDYLVVDMPPGTGDIQLTLAQKVPVSGAVIVTTPQDIALLDCRKGIEMFRKVDIPVLGVVENMAVHICSACGHAEHLFGAGGGERVAKGYGVPLLGSLPLDIRIREQTDGGTPTVVAEPGGALAASYRAIARGTALALLRRQRSAPATGPVITISND